jgi:hypothetical protein
MLEVKGQTGDKSGEEHDGDVEDGQAKLQREIEAHDHVDRVQDDPVTDAHHINENMDLFPKREVDGMQEKRHEKDQQG